MTRVVNVIIASLEGERAQLRFCKAALLAVFELASRINKQGQFFFSDRKNIIPFPAGAVNLSYVM